MHESIINESFKKMKNDYRQLFPEEITRYKKYIIWIFPMLLLGYTPWDTEREYTVKIL